MICQRIVRDEQYNRIISLFPCHAHRQDPKQVSDCRGSGALKGWLGTGTPERPRGHGQNDSRRRFINIVVYGPTVGALNAESAQRTF